MKLVFATGNKHKIREIRLLAPDWIEVVGKTEAGIVEELPETHDTLEANAIEKAQYLFGRLSRNCFSEDTGLEIEALGGRPGVYTARFAGVGCTTDDNIRKTLELMRNESNREAQFRTVICLIISGKQNLFEGILKGWILKAPHGKGGFGYDPIFQPEGYSESLATLSPHLKSGISHRALAFSKMLKYLHTIKG